MPTHQYEFARSSRDLLRLVGGLILLLLGLVLATIFSDALLGFETDLVRLVRGLPEGLAVIVFGTIRVRGTWPWRWRPTWVHLASVDARGHGRSSGPWPGRWRHRQGPRPRGAQ